MSRAFATVCLVVALAACGGAKKPADDPRGGGRCTHGEYFVPGCSDEPGIVAGCYEKCPYGAACPAGTTCTQATVMPVCAMSEGDVACDACAEDLELCLPGGDDSD